MLFYRNQAFYSANTETRLMTLFLNQQRGGGNNLRVTFVQVLKNHRKSSENFRQPSCDLRTSVKNRRKSSEHFQQPSYNLRTSFGESSEIFGKLSDIFDFFISIKKTPFHNFMIIIIIIFVCLFACLYVCLYCFHFNRSLVLMCRNAD